MVLLHQLWDDVVTGLQPGWGLKTPQKGVHQALEFRRGEGSNGGMLQRSLSTLSSPSTPGTPTNVSPTAKRDNVWRSVFNPGSNLAMKSIGSDYFDKPQPNSPIVYDWLYSGDTRSNKHR